MSNGFDLQMFITSKQVETKNSITDPEMSLLNRQSFAWGAYSHLFQQHLFFNHMIKAGSSAKVLLQPKTNVGSDRVRNAEPQLPILRSCYLARYYLVVTP